MFPFCVTPVQVFITDSTCDEPLSVLI